jgi:GDP-L-fucose synthase
MEKGSKIWVAGHTGMVGSAIVRKLKEENFNNIIVVSSKEVDLRDAAVTRDFLKLQQPEYIFMAAAKVGGIVANDTYRAQFLFDNLMIEANVIHQSYLNNVKKLLFLGSSCIYPKMAPQPLKEEYLLSGYLESTNEPYAIAKIAGIKLCESYRFQYGCDFISAMPCNLYGPNDNYNLTSSHVIPALIRKFVEAKSQNEAFVEVWGSGTPLREFLHVNDLATACLFLMNNYSDSQFINIGTGEDLSIAHLAELIRKLVNFRGEIRFDKTKPDGTPRKLMDVGRLRNLGWQPTIGLEDGLRQIIQQKEIELVR